MAHADARGAVTARALVGDVDGSGIRSVRTVDRKKFVPGARKRLARDDLI